MVRYCSVHARTETATPGLVGSSSTAAAAPSAQPTGEIIRINVTFVIDTQHDVPDQRIFDQHRTLNEYFSARNASLAMMPRGPGSRYNFSAVVGNPNIQFNLKPLVRKFFGHTVSKLADLEDVQGTDGVTVFITQIQGKNLGESEVGGNRLVIDSGTVGGTTHRGTKSPYDLGLTLVHEMGHALGLVHNFDSPCTVNYPDVPIQKEPNMVARFTNGDATDDNQHFHCSGQTDRSCSSAPCTNSALPFEQFMNVMDYGSDDDLIMFSKAQAEAMRAYLRGNGAKYTTRSSETLAYTIDARSSAGGVSTWGWVLIALGVVAVITVITLLYIQRRK
jgi:hypothetical protein